MKYEKVQNLIFLKAWEYSKKYKVEFEELRDQGNLIYVEALRTHQAEKAAFITHLYSRLRTLGDHAKTLYRQGGRAGATERVYETIGHGTLGIFCPEAEDSKHHEERLELDYGVTQFLSEEAKTALDWLLSQEWQIPGNSRKPTRNSFIAKMRALYSWSHSQAFKVWNELKEVWQEHQYSGAQA